ncbi:leucine-rich repeat protein kinase family protein isoform X2 [Tasmannia lanceolata]|uniref:leucine-rich repeat protein kinase family protein isoform X2 n=1 Tax=Tasmannia lanceolata TaxID=3420 RepID=UPI004063531B
MQFSCLVLILWVEFVIGQTDLDALLEFKKGIEKDASGQVFGSWNGTSLNSDQCPYNWYGIECSGDHVTSITLQDLGLEGSVNFSALSELKMLRNLSVSNNRLTGILSPDVGSIGSLEILDVSCNSFHGSIPVELTNLTNLVHLNLSLNNFSGPVPPDLAKLQQLKYFDLRSNGFSGDIGGILLQLQILVYVDISCNGFSESLDLGFNNSTFVPSVQYLNISHNVLVGELFASSMPLFDNLVVFDASNNQLTGQIPSFNFIVSLEILRLGSNQFSGSLPVALLQESSMVLSELDLSCNQLEGPIGSITSMTLQTLNLSSNKLSGSLPAKVGHCAFVDLSNNMLSGNLSVLQSWGNYVEAIHLSSNSLTGTLPNETSQFLRLTSLEISNNSLQGVLPLVIGTYPELSSIDLSLNQLNGFLPPSLFTSLRLTELNLSGNSFTGPIPLLNSQTAISASSEVPLPSPQNMSLVSLDLSNNLLSGSLPAEIGTMDQLKLLNIENNNISGQIPKEIGNSLLIFPSGSPKNGPYIMSRRKQGMKPAIRAALIAGFVGGAVLVTLFFVLIYYRTHTQEHRRRQSSTRNVRGKDTNQGPPPLPHHFGLQKSVDPSPSFSFSQDYLLSSGVRSVPEHGDISLVESTTKSGTSVKSPASGSSMPMNIIKSSPVSLFSSSPLSSGPHLSEHSDALTVCSPDRLAGDLHFFDSSFVFTAEELSRAPAEVLGRSCHGTSYKATLDSGRVLTVKWLREGIVKGKKEFAREAKKLGNIRHPNIVSLRGYYWGPKEHEKLIISDYINAECLALHLYDTEPRKFPPLSPNQRLKVAIDVARSLRFLHTERAIPHGNLKSTNILLEASDLNAFLTDYSLHRIMNPAGTAEQVLNAGALGYRPPEFTSTSKPCPSLKSDIYAFGVILLELLTGKSAGEIVSGNTGVVDLTDWVRLLASENRSIECFDRLIPGVDSVEGPPKGLQDMLHVSLRCILPASERPDIRTIFEDLSSIVL